MELINNLPLPFWWYVLFFMYFYWLYSIYSSCCRFFVALIIFSAILFPTSSRVASTVSLYYLLWGSLKDIFCWLFVMWRTLCPYLLLRLFPIFISKIKVHSLRHRSYLWVQLNICTSTIINQSQIYFISVYEKSERNVS